MKVIDDDAATVPLFQRAIRLDPDFAMAYASLGQSYWNLGETNLAEENTSKAYDLLSRVSEREKFFIESHYYGLVTGDSEKAQQAYELWAQTYPRDFIPPRAMGIIYEQLGQYDKALAEGRKALRLMPSPRQYANVARSYLDLGRLGDAMATYQEGIKRTNDSEDLHAIRYDLAFFQGDSAEMERQVSWAAGKPGVDDLLLSAQSDTEAFAGRLRSAREFSHRAVESARRNNKKDVAAALEMKGALLEAEFGNSARATDQVTSVLSIASNRDAQILAAVALARAGDSTRVVRMADGLQKRFPLSTLMNGYWLPAIRALIDINRSNPSKAIEALQAAGPYELGNGDVAYALYPVYVRGEAYLAARQGKEAAAEFQKVLDHRGVVVNEPIGALAHLQIGRAYAMQGDTAKARAAYQDFLALWKDADPDIPIFIAAKSEYAKLQ